MVVIVAKAGRSRKVQSISVSTERGEIIPVRDISRSSVPAGDLLIQDDVDEPRGVLGAILSSTFEVATTSSHRAIPLITRGIP